MTAPALAARRPHAFANRVGQALALAMTILIGLQVAWWGWRFWSPPSVAAANPVAAIDQTLARTLFGESAAVPRGPAITVAVSNIRVKGVYAASGKTPSAAIINTGARDQVVRIDEKIAEGVTLVEVHADRIVISRNGVRESIEVDRSPKALSVGSLNAPRGSPSPSSSAGFRLNVSPIGATGFSLSRNELNGVLQDPRQLDHLGRVGSSPSGGARIDEANAGSLAQKLGLKSGDVIVSINGQPVAGPGDLAKFYGQFSTLASVRAEIRRDGAPIVLNYAIQQ